jgi:tetratricopeptide (TPR) repeat protein
LNQWFAVVWHLDRLIAARPMDAELPARRGDALSRLGRWAEAEQAYGKAIALGAAQLSRPELNHSRGEARARLRRWSEADTDFVVDIERRGDTRSSYYHALLRLQLGDIDGFRDTCERMLARWAQSEDLLTINRLAVASTLAPDAVADLARPIRVAKKAVALESKSAWSQGVLGRALYRGGRYAEAVEHLEQAVAIQNDERYVWHWLFLAMAYHDLGSPTQARAWLKKAVTWIDSELSKPPRGVPGGTWLSWNQRLELLLLRREAELLIKEGRPLYLPANVFQEAPGPEHAPASRDR